MVDPAGFYSRFKDTIEDLSALHALTVTPDPARIPPKDTVKDRLASGTLIHLVVPADLRRSLELDLPKLEAKKAKLIKEMEKMNLMVSGDNYKVKATAEAQRTHAKKVVGGPEPGVVYCFFNLQIATLEEKLARINYIQSISNQ